VRAKIAKSFARIHKANLCNFGILPLVLKDPKDYDLFGKGSRVTLPGVRERIEKGEKEIPVEVNGHRVITILDVSERQRKHLVAGGTLNAVKDELERAKKQ
jgi:aconitate hydratase